LEEVRRHVTGQWWPKAKVANDDIRNVGSCGHFLFT
jgi:hypothetical protein